MEQHDGASKNDLHLRFSRGRSTEWEPIQSPGKYLLPAVARKTQYGTVYSQGVFLDATGKTLSQEDVARLIDLNGYSSINSLEGDFAIAVDDKRHGIWCATDSSGTLPLYYKLTLDELVISTRAENLRAASESEIDVAGIIAVLNSGYPWGDLTLLKTWKMLRPGYIVRIDPSDSSSVQCYFDPETDESVQGFQTSQELVDAIDSGLKSIASRYKRILLPLSGGVDSRLIAVRCHALGIPFEAITFVANVPDGDDFDIASRLVKVFGVKHHRWEWKPSVENCIERFTQLCIATGGSNDAYTSYPDGMGTFRQVASGFDCIMRGDHVFGIGPYSDTVHESSYLLNINFTDNLNWVLKPAYQNVVDIKSVFEEQEGILTTATGPAANAWRHVSYRKSRSPRFLLPIGQLQSQHTEVTYPFLTREIVSRMSRTDPSLRDEKRIAHETLAACSPPDIQRIPLSSQPTWKNTEPLLNLPKEIIDEMIRIVGQGNVLSDIVDDSVITDGYETFLSSQNGGRKQQSLKSSLKQIIKNALPKRILGAYQKKSRQHRRAPSHLIFKRYFAMKVFLNSISGK